MHWDRILVLTMVLAALPACEPSRGGGDLPPGAQVLDGVWTVEFTLTSPLLPGHMPRSQRIAGELALLRNTSLADHAGLSGRPTHSGTYDARFIPFGFDVNPGREAPALEARLAGGDSVEVTLQPGSAAAFRMRGLLAGDSVVGEWAFDHERGGAASGSFVMRRKR